MSQCQVCNLNKSERLILEKGYLNNQSQASLSREFNVSVDSIRNHMQSHVSRQLVKSVEMRQAMESGNMLQEIEDLLSKSKHIMHIAEKEGKLNTALNAIKETRGTLELMSRIAVTLHQIKIAELQAQEIEQEDSQTESMQEGLSRLSNGELDMFMALTEKMQGIRTDDVIKTVMDEIKNNYFTPPTPTRRRRVIDCTIEDDTPVDIDGTPVDAQEEHVVEPLETLTHEPLGLDPLSLSEELPKKKEVSAFRRKESGFEYALRTGQLRTSPNRGR